MARLSELSEASYREITAQALTEVAEDLAEEIEAGVAPSDYESILKEMSARLYNRRQHHAERMSIEAARDHGDYLCKEARG